MKLLFEKGTCGTKRQSERGEGGGEGGGRDREQSRAPSDATGSPHSLPPNKGRVGQDGEKMMPNCQQSHLKSLHSPLNKDTFLIGFSKLFLKCLSEFGWKRLLFFLSEFLFPTPHAYPPLPLDRHLPFLLGAWFLATPEIKKSKVFSKHFLYFFAAPRQISLHFVAEEWINKKCFNYLLQTISSFLVYRGRVLDQIPK